MTYRDILVHARSTGSTEPVEVAVRLAKRFGARLTALYAMRDAALFKTLLPQGSPQIDDFMRREYEAAAGAERRLRALTEREGVALDWQVGEGEPADLLGIAVRLADLVVVGKTEPGDLGKDVVEQMVTTVTRPTIVVPGAGPFLTIGERVLVAWNDSLQSAAAVLQGRPFLVGAKHVTVLVGEGRERFTNITRRPPSDIRAYLERHGIHAEYRPIGVADADAGGAILNAARELQADLIVMGAYGRSRLREWVLGGATQLILEHTSIPVLMAH